MESKTCLVLESKQDYRIIPKGRAQFLLKHLANVSSSEESNSLCNGLFSNNICLALMLWVCVNSIRATKIMFSKDVHNWMNSLSQHVCVALPDLSGFLFKGLNSCSLALKEAAASIYGWEIPTEECAVGLFIPLQCVMGEFSEVLKSLTKDMALCQASCWFTCSAAFLSQSDA